MTWQGQQCHRGWVCRQRGRAGQRWERGNPELPLQPHQSCEMSFLSLSANVANCSIENVQPHSSSCFSSLNANCWRFKRGRKNPIFNLIHSCWLFLAVLSLLVLYLAVLSLAVFTQVFWPLMSLLSQLRCQISFIEAAGQNCLTMYNHFCKANHYGQYHEVLFSRCKLYNYGIQEDVEDLLLNHLRKAGSDLNHPLTESTRWVLEKWEPVPWAALFP